jgi:hypothetical protein
VITATDTKVAGVKELVITPSETDIKVVGVKDFVRETHANVADVKVAVAKETGAAA